MRTPLALLILALALPLFADEDTPKDAPKVDPEQREFTSRTGKSVMGKVISRIDDENYLLKNPAGKSFKLRLSSLADSDQEFLKRWNPNFPVDLSKISLEDVLPKMGYSSADLLSTGIGPIVTLTIDGKDVKLLVDPKANNSILDKEVADDIGLDLTKSNSAFKDAAGNQVVAEQAADPTVKFGDSLPVGGPILVISLEVIGGANIKNNADGIMGSDLLQRTNAILDFNAGKLHVRP